MKSLMLAVALANVGPLVSAADPAPVQIDPVDVRWTFGAHEPYTMYRRIGRRTTGGVDGNATLLAGSAGCCVFCGKMI